MNNEERYVVFIIILIWLSIFIILYLIFVYRELYIQCDTEESPYCFSFTCSTQATETCGKYAYRCVNNGVVCSSTPYTIRKINSLDNICS